MKIITFDVTGFSKIITIRILPNISRSKDNQTMKFGLIKHEKYFFLKNNTQNVVEKQVPDPFIKNQNLANLCINNLKCYKVSFYCISQSLPKYIKTKIPTTYFYLIKIF